MAHTIATNSRVDEEVHVVIIDPDEEKEIAELRHSLVQAAKRKRVEYVLSALLTLAAFAGVPS
jgi:hypothetical protein